MAKVVVLGGGAAGLVASWRAASLGHAVLLVEGNPRPGAKLRITGGGRCNLTHAGNIPSFLAAFPSAQARFLRPSLHAFPSEALRALMAKHGVATSVREDGCVFPLGGPGTAGQIAVLLETLAREAGVVFRSGVRAVGLEGRAPRLEALRMANGARIEGDLFLLATGGASYPETGSRGEVLAWLKALDIPTRPWAAALAPIPLRHPRREWEGVSLRSGILELRKAQGAARIAEAGGDLVFTGKGISGPAALALSQAVEAARRQGGAWLSCRTVALTPEALDAQLLSQQSEHPRLAVHTLLSRHLPERLCAPLLAENGLPGEKRLAQLAKGERRILAALLLALPLGEAGSVPLARGEVTAGGIALETVDPRSMALKGWENLRACGELLDLDGPVGGYNLQAAFSTGFAAGSIPLKPDA